MAIWIEAGKEKASEYFEEDFSQHLAVESVAEPPTSGDVLVDQPETTHGRIELAGNIQEVESGGVPRVQHPRVHQHGCVYAWG